MTSLSFFALIIYSIYRIVKLANKKNDKSKSGTKKEDEKLKFTIEITSDNQDDETYYTRIAGVKYRNTKKDIGGFLGYISPEPTNPHDKNAIAVYRNDGKLIGYIPKDETRSFRRWSSRTEIPCVGYICEGNEVPLFGRVKAIDASQEQTKLIVVKYVRWMVRTYGSGFVPVGFRVNGKDLNTDDQWIEALDSYISDEKKSCGRNQMRLHTAMREKSSTRKIRGRAAQEPSKQASHILEITMHARCRIEDALGNIAFWPFLATLAHFLPTTFVVTYKGRKYLFLAPVFASVRLSPPQTLWLLIGHKSAKIAHEFANGLQKILKSLIISNISLRHKRLSRSSKIAVRS